MSEIQEYLSYGAVGIAAFFVIKLVLPFFQLIINKASVESRIYGNAKDWIDYTNEQLKTMQDKYSVLQKELEKEQEKCRELQRRFEELTNGHDEK